MGQEEVVYWLDASDSILAVNASWDLFARENDGEAFLKERVIGKPIWHFISGDPTRMWLDTLVDYARISGKPVIREYRCDSPKTKRFMEMCISPEADQQVRLTHRILRVESMAPPVSFEAAPDTVQPLCFRCSICNRVQIKGQWQEGDAAARSGLLAVKPVPRVAYRVCEDCQDEISDHGGSRREA